MSVGKNRMFNVRIAAKAEKTIRKLRAENNANLAMRKWDSEKREYEGKPADYYLDDFGCDIRDRD